MAPHALHVIGGPQTWLARVVLTRGLAVAGPATGRGRQRRAIVVTAPAEGVAVSVERVGKMAALDPTPYGIDDSAVGQENWFVCLREGPDLNRLRRIFTARHS